MILIFFRNIAFFKCFAYQWPALDKEQRGGSEARDSHTVFWNLKACCPSRSVLSTRSSIFSPRSRTRSVKYEEGRRQGGGEETNVVDHHILHIFNLSLYSGDAVRGRVVVIAILRKMAE
jgi:hypothetical protein